jgi:hypothetical protein
MRFLAEDARNFLGAVDLIQLRMRYAAWVSSVESRLIALFSDSATWEGLRSANYWSICDKNHGHIRMAELVRDEVEHQASRLEQLSTRLRASAAWLDASPGQLAVLDTHVLLHFLPPAQVKWQKVVGSSPVRLDD